MGYTDSETRDAKALKQLVQDETGEKRWSHTRCLALVRQYAPLREGRKRQEFAAFIFATEGQHGDL